ncbi:hypothetical protein QHF84_49595, partial [Polyangium sp. y55x31]|nr:hypothetical protein [Polyangium sp. y55x31]
MTVRSPYPAGGGDGAVACGAAAESAGWVSGDASGGLAEVEAEAPAFGFASGSDPPVNITTAPAVSNATAPPAIASMSGGGRFFRLAGCAGASVGSAGGVEAEAAGGTDVEAAGGADVEAAPGAGVAVGAPNRGNPGGAPIGGATGGAAIGGGTGGAAIGGGGFGAAGGTGGGA